MTNVNALVLRKINSMDLPNGTREDLIAIIELECLLGESKDERERKKKKCYEIVQKRCSK